MNIPTIPTFESYGEYTSYNYGVNSLVFTDSQGNRIYYSYKTIVAFCHDGQLYCCENAWSKTTGKHLNFIQKYKSKRMPYEAYKAKFKEVFGVEYKDNY